MTKWLGVSGAALLAVSILPIACASDGAPREQQDATVRLEGRTYDLSRAQGEDELSARLAELREQARQQVGEKKARREAGSKGRRHEARKPGKKGRDLTPRHVRDGLSEMAQTVAALRDGRMPRPAAVRHLQEVSWAFDSNYRRPPTWRPALDILTAPFQVRDLTLNAVGRGSSRKPAVDLAGSGAGDLSLVDPLPSSFWSRPSSIAKRDLYWAFGRSSLPRMAEDLVTFDSAHHGYGIHPGFHVRWNGQVYKVKFGEQNTEPFETRLMWVLGFPVRSCDYVAQVRIAYDRRILTEFSARRTNATPVRLAGLTVMTVRDGAYNDPFQYIEGAVLKDGHHISGEELRRRLLSKGTQARLPRRPEQHPELFNTEVERQISYLLMTEANIHPKDTPGSEELGFWDYNTYDHPDRRELRGMGLLMAWLDNWDVRWGNNQLAAVGTGPGARRLEHVVADMGVGLGNSGGFIRRIHGRLYTGLQTDEPNIFPWAFTRPLRTGQTSVPISGYMPETKVGPFYRMNIDDARWMARLIGQLTENQIRQALVASGWEAAPARLVLEKLISRRDRMVRDLGLGQEIAPLRPAGVDERLNYDPRTDGPMAAVLADGTKVEARDSGRYVVYEGALRTRDELARAKERAHSQDRANRGGGGTARRPGMATG